MVANVEIVVLDIDRLPWAGSDALPAEETLGHVIPYSGWNRVFSLQNSFVEAFKGDAVLDETVHWLAPFLRRLED